LHNDISQERKENVIGYVPTKEKTTFPVVPPIEHKGNVDIDKENDRKCKR